MKNRSIAAILKSEALDMAGTTVKQPLPTGGDYRFSLPSQHNAMVYIVSGEVALPSGFAYPAENLLHYRNDGEGIRLVAKTDCRLLLLAGEPIEEPVAQWGPYVMNSQTEIMQAMRDYQMGKMGVYID